MNEPGYAAITTRTRSKESLEHKQIKNNALSNIINNATSYLFLSKMIQRTTPQNQCLTTEWENKQRQEQRTNNNKITALERTEPQPLGS